MSPRLILSLPALEERAGVEGPLTLAAKSGDFAFREITQMVKSIPDES